MRLAAILATLLTLLPGPHQRVSVAYAASLVRVMEGPVARAFTERTGLAFQGEPRGSKALATFIAEGIRTPDVFITADPKLLGRLRDRSGSMIASASVFASARMVLGCARSSPYAARLRAARSPADVRALLETGARVGRTDPRIDPKGERTVAVLSKLGAQSAAGRESVFPEEELLARVGSGELDCAFFYSTEINDPQIERIELPRGTNLDGEIRYAIAVLRDAPNPEGARRFADFLIRGEGRRLLRASGLGLLARQ